MSGDPLEKPSGKHARSENFPVASWLMRADVRPHLLVFYAFARAIDDIADAPDLEPAERRRRLGAFDAVLARTVDDGPAKALALRASLDATGVSAAPARDLIAAFVRDTRQCRYVDWDDLISYCRLSAAPVGRHILALHGEREATWPASDALCHALQIINHLQDCGADYQDLDRVYIPEPWLKAEGLGVEILAAERSPPALRRVLDRLLQPVRALLETSAEFAHQVNDRRLALEIAAIQALAERLVRELERRDPLAERVKLDRTTMAMVGFRGAVGGWWRRFASGTGTASGGLIAG